MKYKNYKKLDIRFRLENKNTVPERMVSHPYLGDMCVTYYIVVPNASDGMLPVTLDMVSYWGICTDDLFSHVKEEMEEYCTQQVIHFCFEEEGDDEAYHMYVLTNSGHLLGAASILYGSALKELSSELGKSFYILPSSKHEVCLVPTDAFSETEYLSFKSAIYDGNRDRRVVAENEVLTDDILFYDHVKDEISLPEVAYVSKDS